MKGRTRDTVYAEILSNTITWTTTHNRIKVQRNPYYLKPRGNTGETDTIGYKTQKTKTTHSSEMLVCDRGKFKILIFRNNRPDRDDDSTHFVEMTSPRM